MAKSKQERFLEHYQPVHKQFERFCRARAFGDMPYQDLMNDTLLIAYRKIDTLQNKKAFLSFLIGIAIRVLSNASKKRRPLTGVDEFIFNNHADTTPTIDKKFEIEMLHKALSYLPEQQREALILFEITGYSIKEIMKIQNSGASAVKQRLARGRKELAIRITKLMEIKGDNPKVTHITHSI